MKYWLLIFTSVLLVSCAVHEIPKTSLAIENYHTSPTPTMTNMIKDEPYKNISRVNFVVINTDSTVEPARYKELVKYSLNSLGFKEIIDKEEFAHRIIEKGIPVSSSSDLVSLRKIADVLGPFLVIDSSMMQSGSAGYWISTIRITDPETSSILLEAERRGMTLIDADKEYTYPIMNVLRSWYLKSR